MPYGWVAAAAAAYTAISAADSEGEGGYQQTGGGGSPQFYMPGGVGAADQSWQDAMRVLSEQSQGMANTISPALLQAYQQQMAIDPSGYAAAGQQAGQQYGQLAGMAQQYAGMMGEQAQGNIAQQNALRQAGAQAMQQGGSVFDTGRDTYGAGREMYGAGREMYGAGKQIFQTAQDPQNQLHNFMKQQTVDDSRAASSARGIGMSANSAGLESDANRRFEMDWQNNQLARQLAGFQGLQGGFAGMRGGFQDLEGGFRDLAGGYQTGVLGGLEGMAGANASANQTGALARENLAGSMNLASQVPGYTMQGAQAQMQGQRMAAQYPADVAMQYGQNFSQGPGAMLQQVQNQAIPYMNYGQGAQNNAFQAFSNSRNFNANQQEQMGQALGNFGTQAYNAYNMNRSPSQYDYYGNSGGYAPSTFQGDTSNSYYDGTY